MWRSRSAGAIGAGAGWAASGAERKEKGAAARSSGLNMALLKERRRQQDGASDSAQRAP